MIESSKNGTWLAQQSSRGPWCWIVDREHPRYGWPVRQSCAREVLFVKASQWIPKFPADKKAHWLEHSEVVLAEVALVD